MGGELLYSAHHCEPPREQFKGSRWRCDCGREWRCVVSPSYFSSGSMAFAARWNRGWWDVFTERWGSS